MMKMDVKKFKLTGSQENMYSIEQIYTNTPMNNVTGLFVFDQEVNIQMLIKALNYCIRDNDSNRLQLGLNEDSSPFQYLANYVEESFKISTFSNTDEVFDFAQKIADTPIFGFYKKLYTVDVFTLPQNRGGFIFNFHHLISDAWTIQLLIDSALCHYLTLIGSDEVIPELPNYSYLDYTSSYEEYLKSNKYIKDKEFWKNTYSSLPTPITLPVSLSNEVDFLDCSATRKTFPFSQKEMNEIRKYCDDNKITLYSFFLAIHSLYLSRINNIYDFAIGTPVLNRTNVKEKNTSGLFIDTIPFSISVDTNSNFIDLATKITTDTMTCFRHQKYPYQHILKDIKDTTENTESLYNILYSYQRPRSDEKIGNVKYTATWFQPNAIFNDLQIHIHDISDSGLLSLSYDYKLAKFSEKMILDMFSRIKHLIKQVITSVSKTKLSDYEIVTENEKQKLLFDFNNTHVEYDKTETIHSLIEKQALKTPDKVALINNDKKITYKELNSRANQIAHYLRSCGIKKNSFVGLLCNRSIEMFIALLGILKSGAAYLPIDPEYPTDRISYMIDNSETQLVLSKAEFFDLIPDKISKIDISLEEKNLIYSHSTINPKKINSSEDLAYIIYTSGSTGKPKGVKLKHININNFILGTTAKINFSINKNILSITTVCFDIFVLESFLPLQNGLTVILANEKEQNDIKLLNELCLKYNVNIIQTTPSRLNKLSTDSLHCKYFENLTDILVGGEPLPLPLLENLKKLSKKANIYNMYGPTETAVWSTIKDLSKSSNITIGSPIANTTTYVLDEATMKLMPIGCPGILFIGGDGVSSGYHKRDDLNSKLFVENPYNKNEIIYNTNDLVKQLPNGEFVHLGRADFQVKIRGYRIELGEIENKVLSYADIKETVIVSHESQFLICYYSAHKDIIISDLISYLLESLPNYMVPAYFIKLDTLPLTPNGKIDRKKLPKPNLDQKEILELAKTNTEKLLEQTILKLLNNGMEHVDINTPFISLGLDSLSIVQLQSMLLGHKLNLTTQTFYKFSNIKKLAAYIDKSETIHNEIALSLDPSFLHSENEKATKNFNDSELGNVFLTGANGFIGIHILKELLDTTNSKIYCLVRGADVQSSLARLQKSYKYYFGLSINKYLNRRVFVINGDITKNNLNLSIESKNMLENNTNTIIHTAAVVKHYGNFEEFKNINIDGTKNLADFALKHNLRFIHLSSISISGNYLLKQDNHDIDFSENNLYIGQHYTENVYVNSKLEAENVIYSYMKKGLRGKVLRIGIISGRYSDGFFQENISANAFYSRIKSLATLKIVSKSMLTQKLEFTPIDECVRAIVLLSKTTQYDNKIFHLYNHNLISVENVLTVLKRFKISVLALDDEEFKNQILEYTKSINSDISAIVNDFDTSNLSLNYNFTVNIKSDFTQKILNDLGFKWKNINNTYLYKIFKHMLDVGFIK